MPGLLRLIQDLVDKRPYAEIVHHDGRIQTGLLDRAVVNGEDIELHLVNPTLRNGGDVRPTHDLVVPFRVSKVESVSASVEKGRRGLVIHLDYEHGFAVHITKLEPARSA